MATLNSTDRLTAIEQVKRSGFDPDSRRIIEQMSVTNEMLLDAPIVMANDRTVNTQVIRTALPHATHRVYNQGVGSTASQTDVIHDVVAQLAIYSKVDKSLVDNAANPQDFLMGEQAAFIDGLAQDQAFDILYGNHTKDKACIDGFATRRNKLVKGLCLDAKGAAGTGTNNRTSIYLIKWGASNVKYIYPREANGLGVKRVDKGVQTISAYDGNGEHEAYVNYYQCDYGIAIGDQRSLIRLANIDVEHTTGEELIKAVLKAKAFLPQGDGTVSILCNSDVMSMFDIATVEKNNVVYTAQDPWGRELNMIRDMRLRRCDSIGNTEAVVS